MTSCEKSVYSEVVNLRVLSRVLVKVSGNFQIYVRSKNKKKQQATSLKSVMHVSANGDSQCPILHEVETKSYSGLPSGVKQSNVQTVCCCCRTQMKVDHWTQSGR